MNAAKGKRQVSLTLTLTTEDYDHLVSLACEADRTLAGYIRWVLKEYLKELDETSGGQSGENVS